MARQIREIGVRNSLSCLIDREETVFKGDLPYLSRPNLFLKIISLIFPPVNFSQKLQ